MTINPGIILGTGLAALNAALCLAALRWAFSRSDKAFFGVFYAGIFWKLLILAFTTLAVAIYARGILAPTLISLAVSTVLFNLLEIGFLPKPEKSAHGF